MSFQTVLTIVGIAFTAFEMYHRFRPKSSSGSVQSPISPRAEPKQSGGNRESSDSGCGAWKAGESQAPARVATTSETPRSAAELCSGFAVSSKIGMA